jgi:hypothetical protein
MSGNLAKEESKNIQEWMNVSQHIMGLHCENNLYPFLHGKTCVLA